MIPTISLSTQEQTKIRSSVFKTIENQTMQVGISFDESFVRA